MKKAYLILIIIAVLVIVVLLLRGQEDSWIKDSQGKYLEHGAPEGTPDYVIEQQDAITCALNLYLEKKTAGMKFESQCLGTCGDYAVDMVNVPRNADDDKVENHCEDYRSGKVTQFIELDKDGNIFRIG